MNLLGVVDLPSSSRFTSCLSRRPRTKLNAQSAQPCAIARHQTAAKFVPQHAVAARDAAKQLFRSTNSPERKVPASVGNRRSRLRHPYQSRAARLLQRAARGRKERRGCVDGQRITMRLDVPLRVSASDFPLLWTARIRCACPPSSFRTQSSILKRWEFRCCSVCAVAHPPANRGCG